jgi:quinol monooxygenase YgiN
MAFAAVLELRLDPTSLEQASIVLHRVLEETRAFNGNLGVEVLIDDSDPAHWLILESWESATHDAAYRTFRAGPGAITDLAPLLIARPSLVKGPINSEV